MEWGQRSNEILNGLGAGLDDPEFVRAWKDLHDETRTPLQAWRRFVETDAEPTEAWPDEAIVEWRRQSRRSRDLSR